MVKKFYSLKTMTLLRLDRFKYAWQLQSLLAALVLMACGSSGSYSDLLEEELSSGVTNDSIFFNIYFGDSRKDFFNKCWEQNKKGILYHGASNQTVGYTIKQPTDSVSDIIMRFYPDFSKAEEIRKMDITFAFSGWAIWNDHLHASELVPYVSDILLKWYKGNPFYIQSGEDGSNSLIKIDGNREIKIWYTGNHYVNVSIEDKSYNTK